MKETDKQIEKYNTEVDEYNTMIDQRNEAHGICAPSSIDVRKYGAVIDDAVDVPFTLDVAQQRKNTPLYSGVRVYFPDALEALARVSLIGNDQHNPGTPLHWDRSKSGDELDSADRHLNDRAKGIVFDTDGQRHLAKAMWRIGAALQKEIEAQRAADLLSETLYAKGSDKGGDPNYSGAQAINVKVE